MQFVSINLLSVKVARNQRPGCADARFIQTLSEVRQNSTIVELTPSSGPALPRLAGNHALELWARR